MFLTFILRVLAVLFAHTRTQTTQPALYPGHGDGVDWRRYPIAN